MLTLISPSARYLELVTRHPLRPIRSAADHDRATAMINSLLDLPRRTRDEEDYLDVLGDLVERYETEIYPEPSVSGADMLAHLIEDRNTTQAEVAAGTGLSKSTLSEILKGKRSLNTRHIAKLAEFFEVDAGLFLEQP